MKGRFFMLKKEIRKGRGNPMNTPDQFAETILKLHRALVGTSELEDFPEQVLEPIRDVISFNQLYVFLAGNYDSPPAMITRLSKTLPWDTIHPEITTADLHSSIVFKGKPGDIFLSQDMTGPGSAGDRHALELIRLKSGARFSIHLILSVTQGARLFLSLFRINDPFKSDEAETMGLLAPAMIMYANALLVSRLFGSEDYLLSGSKENADFHYLLLDHNLETIDLPESTRGFLAAHFNDPMIRGLPAPLREWLDNSETMDRSRVHKDVRHTIFKSSTGRIDCKLHMFDDSAGPSRALIVLHFSWEVDNFTPLGDLGLSPQEIRVLGILYAGKRNSIIAEHLGIKESTICKHLRNIGKKLHAKGRTEILAKAIEARDVIPSVQRLSAAKPLVSPTSNQMPKNFPHPDNWCETVIDLNKRLPLLTDFNEAPELLRSSLSRNPPFDWAAIYCIKAGNEIEKIVTSPGLRCDWAKLYPAIRKFIRWVPIARMAEPGEIFLSQDITEPTNEQDLFVKAVIEASTGAFYSLQMPIAKTYDHQVVLGLYRNDPGHPNTQEEVAFTHKISPIILSWAQSMVLLRESTIRQMGCQILLESEHVRAMLLDRHLCDVMWTKDALGLLVAQVGTAWRDLLLPRLRKWIKQTRIMHEKRKGVDRTWPARLIIDSFNLECCAYPLDGHILINFKRHPFEESFAVLEKCGLTEREIQVLAYLRLGYSNRQIASAMSICSETVKKHLGHIGGKLDAFGRTAIMRRAEQLKRLLSTQ